LERQIEQLYRDIAAVWEDARDREQMHLEQNEPVLASRAADPKQWDQRKRANLRKKETALEASKEKIKQLRAYIQREEQRIKREAERYNQARAKSLPNEIKLLRQQFAVHEDAVGLLFQIVGREGDLRRLADIEAKAHDLLTEAALLRSKGYTVPELPPVPELPEGFREAFGGVFKSGLQARGSRRLERVARAMRKGESDAAAQKQLAARNERAEAALQEQGA
jgi:hypothetical protein